MCSSDLELTGINDNRFEIKYSGHKIREKEQTKTEQHNIYTPCPPSAIYTLWSIFTQKLPCRRYYLHFTDKHTKAQKGRVFVQGITKTPHHLTE